MKSSKLWPHNGQIMAAVCEINNQKMDNFPIAAISIEEAALKSLRQFVKRLGSFRGWVGGFLSGWFFTGLYLNGLYSRCTRLRWSLLGSAQMFSTRMVLREKKARWKDSPVKWSNARSDEESTHRTNSESHRSHDDHKNVRQTSSEIHY